MTRPKKIITTFTVVYILVTAGFIYLVAKGDDRLPEIGGGGINRGPVDKKVMAKIINKLSYRTNRNQEYRNK